MNKMIPTLLATFLLFGCQEEVTKKETTEQKAQETKPVSEKHTEIKESKEASLPIQQEGKKLDTSDIKAHKQSLENVVADKSCDNDTQCKVIAVGDRACGGPSSYQVYSTKSADEAQVKQLAEQITTLERAYNMQNQMMSICQHLIEPATQCVENKCVKLENSRPTY
ncbi:MULTISPECIES: hypothetical protein [unclassified Pseudoalteromonas]|uniref:hypothetical protein n=1 Tax=unclassified Pseudoalteromonas TaxID=194690 RepID=UPI00110A581E|nr:MULTISPECIES: hypothetical protein [unclassified Pseudoalteromonas]MCG9760768.1 hypothetical protein [Pseudoalteromonas sp. Isolate6]TMN33555.1 hypothetical protein CWC03_19155 [Pseudoalteromonas sp. S2755]